MFANVCCVLELHVQCIYLHMFTRIYVCYQVSNTYILASSENIFFAFTGIKVCAFAHLTTLVK